MANDPMVAKHQPTGGGVYLRAIVEKDTHGNIRYGTGQQCARKAAQWKMRFAPILCCWQDKRGTLKPNSLETVAEYAQCLKDVGVEPWLWGFPRAGFEKEYIETFSAYTKACGGSIVGWLHDPEVWYKWEHRQAGHSPAGMRGTAEFAPYAKPESSDETFYRESARRLVTGTIDAIDESLGVAVTSYGYNWYHPNFPWNQFGGLGFGSPQLYGAHVDVINRSVDEWRALGWSHIVPSIPTFGVASAVALDQHMGDFGQNKHVKGFIAWSWEQTSQAEWAVLAQWSDFFYGR